MSDLTAQTVVPSGAQIGAVIDDAAVSRAQDVLTANGIKIDAAMLRDALDAAVTPEPTPPDIPVSLGMIEAGRSWWIARPADSVHVLLPALYRVMEQQRRDEAGPAQ